MKILLCIGEILNMVMRQINHWFVKSYDSSSGFSTKEDRLIFSGMILGLEGLFTADGSSKISKRDWSEGDNAFTDVVAGISMFRAKA